MIFLRRLAGAGEIKKFGAVEADAIAPPRQALLRLAGEFNVAGKLDAHAVEGFGREIAEFAQLGGHRLCCFHLQPIAGDRLLVRLQDHDPLIAVENHRFATGDIGQKRPQSHHGRNLEPFGDDGSVAARAAQLGGKPLHKPPVEIGRFARREVVGQHHHRLRNGCQRFAPLPQEIPQQALLDVVDVVGTLRDVVVEALESLGVASERAADGVFRPPVPVADGAG